jgi:hypothetical protein
MKYLAETNSNNTTGNIFNGATVGTLPKREGMRTSTKIFIATFVFIAIMSAIRLLGV